jgi:DNA-binding response OmpR family regulator
MTVPVSAADAAIACRPSGGKVALVLLLESDPLAAEEIIVGLALADHYCAWAASTEAAATLLERGEFFDVMIIDGQSAGNERVAASLVAQAAARDIPVILMSVAPIAGVLYDVTFVRKPPRLEGLVEVIETLSSRDGRMGSADGPRSTH